MILLMFLALLIVSVIFRNTLSATGVSVVVADVDNSVVVVVVVDVEVVDDVDVVVVDCAVELVISTIDLSVVITKSKPAHTLISKDNNIILLNIYNISITSLGVQNFSTDFNTDLA